MKLSMMQKETLGFLERNGEQSAYPHLNMGILASLERKDLVSAKRGLGSMATPRTAIKWNITDTGRAALGVIGRHRDAQN